MTEPVYFVELNSPDHSASAAFFRAVFGWDPQPFAAPDYLVSSHGSGAGVDTAILPSRDGAPRTVPIIRVGNLDEALAGVQANGGQVVVEPFALGTMGSACYITDPAGVLVGLHFYNPAP
ncbi:VOC family protein [Cryobacterium arcticum]|uniref:VOC domain-containing protein n=1 Tax=Cryobacterium arcticum TaxID=670052 RepID=A0A1B1BH42_9MICO|nr:VOC family protein [Cryobacterium arcticum]ANP71935.1 hypothetical protein PA27867_0968 [Cryobacterium arcticum]